MVLSTAFRIREEGLIDTVKPIFVDATEDRMCFLVVDNVALKDVHTEFSLPMETTLKVHDSLFAVIEATDLLKSWSAESLKDLSMNFMTEKFKSPEEAREHFAGVVKQLAEYSTTPFETYFFTAPSTAYYFTSAPDSLAETAEFQTDYSRHKAWMAAAAYFKESVSSSPSADKCGFKEYQRMDFIPQKVRISSFIACAYTTQLNRCVQNTVALPMDKLLNNATDGRLAAACTAYLVATFSQVHAINHLAVTFK